MAVELGRKIVKDTKEFSSYAIGITLPLTFGESTFEQSFQTKDHERWRAVSALLRSNKGCVFAEQVAPFLDDYLLGGEDGGGSFLGFFGTVAVAIATLPWVPLPAAIRDRKSTRLNPSHLTVSRMPPSA